MPQRPSYYPAVLAGTVAIYFVLVGVFFHQRTTSTPARDAVGELMWVLAGAAALIAVVHVVRTHDVRSYDPAAAARQATKGYDTDA
ncbi:hypothetical protein [Nocardioides mangrovi]|uniref:Uncharacterized protein n=1 Tax=Nocardioides mangrovi TaxID=2874580 RepID=A0ABS7UHE0_9ACTN|nr:hypothetical protein [Nocardioides mangrovi]MBZ5740416.1 hypothetical protein [Nocardioides mangrovi]